MRIGSTAVKAHRCAAGGKGKEQSQTIGRSRGGRTTKIHAVIDRFCRLLALLLPIEVAADCKTGALLFERLLHRAGGQGLRQRRHTPAEPNIPPEVNRR